MKLYRIIWLLLFIQFFSVVSANETGYEIELIIYEDAQGQYKDSEDWSYNDMLNNTDVSSITKGVDVDPAFTELDWAHAKLSESLKRIQSNARYNVLINKRWKQTGLDRDQAYYIDVSSLKNTTVDKKSTLIIPNNLSSELESSVNNSGISPGQNSYIQGRVKLIMSRYLHFEIKLDYFKKSGDILEDGYRSYPVVSERRMKSREIHYIDHPMIGVIVLATPFEIVSKTNKRQN